MNDLVFVYGTLMKNKRNHHYLNNATFISTSFIEGYFMFDLGTYPGIAKSKYNSKVYGEVYKVDKQTMDKLDELEEVGYLYKKEEFFALANINIFLGHQDKALIYILMGLDKALKERESGPRHQCDSQRE